MLLKFVCRTNKSVKLAVPVRIFCDFSNPHILPARGELERLRGNGEQAGETVEEVLALAASRLMRLDQADAFLSRARLALDRAAGGAPSKSEDAAHRAGDNCDATLQTARQCGYVWAEREALCLLAKSHELLKSDRAAGFAHEARMLSERLADASPPAAGIF